MGIPEPMADLRGVAEQRRWLFSLVPHHGVGAEIGVFRGHLSEVIASECKPRKLFLVDEWTMIGERFGWGGVSYTNYDQLTTADALRDTKDKMAKYERDCEVVIVEENSCIFAENFAKYSDCPLDFAYLDTSHKYPDTKIELEAIAKILAPDGLILGDDWIPDPTHQHHGVMRAVNEFVKSHDFQIVLAGQANQFCLRRTPNYP
jgi:hypothetical protein